MQNVLVSVIIPVYNMESYIDATLKSVLASNYSDLEIVVVDDGSTDNSALKIKALAEQNSNIVFFQQKNGGASRARNFAVSNAKGKYILPVDADNYISTDYIEKAVEVLDNKPNVKVVTCEAEFFGDKVGKWKLPDFSIKLLARKNLIDNCAMYRKADWEIAGGYCNEILGREDWDFWISMLKNGGDVVRLPITGLYYRVHSNSKRKKTRHLKKLLIRQLNDRHKAFFYKHLNGPLHVSRTWSETYNKFIHFFCKETIVCPQEIEDFVYNAPEFFDKKRKKSPVLQVFEIDNYIYKVTSFKELFSFGKSIAQKKLVAVGNYKLQGIYEKRNLIGKCISFFVERTENYTPSTSLIISVYKNTELLKAVLDSLKKQSLNDFEIIIAEDGESVEMKNFIETYKFSQNYKHITQPDVGWRKNAIMNKAIGIASSDWLIFIDGDCVLHNRFIEMHLRFAQTNYILAGKRVKLDQKTSFELLSKKTKIKDMQVQIIKNLFLPVRKLKFNEEGIFISPENFLRFIPFNRKQNKLKGCNMSFSRQAINAINGFDEDYTLPAIGEDIDLTWRFVEAGYTLFSVRNMAVQYHLYHNENWQNQDINAGIMKQKMARNEYICNNGLIKNRSEV
jgi:glycosyltransferase involved in cell wall biosynthesis